MAKKYDSDIVGWVTRGGKRIPIRKGQGNALPKKESEIKEEARLKRARDSQKVGEIKKTLKKQRDYGESDVRDAIEEIKGGKKNSLKGHIGKDGKLLPKRDKHHRDIVDENLKGKVPVEGKATLTMLGGGTASGKSKLPSNVNVKSDKSAVVIDPDSIKEQLDGYSEMAKKSTETASIYHEESSALAKRLYGVAVNENYNVVYDGTGDGSVGSVMKKVNMAREKGYAVNAEYVTVPIEEAIPRNNQRYENAVARGENPRLVPQEELIRIHQGVTDIAVEVAPQYDHIDLYDNTNGYVKIAEGGNGKYLTPIKGQEKLFDKFLEKSIHGKNGFKRLDDGQVVPLYKSDDFSEKAIKDIIDKYGYSRINAIKFLEMKYRNGKK